MKPTEYRALKTDVERAIFNVLKRYGASKKDTFRYKLEFRLDDDTQELIYLHDLHAGRYMT